MMKERTELSSVGRSRLRSFLDSSLNLHIFYFLLIRNLVLGEKLSLLHEHWLIMKQANDLRDENLVLTQSCAERFWSMRDDLMIFLHDTSEQLREIHPTSTSREHIEREQEKYQHLSNAVSQQRMKFDELMDQDSVQLLTLIDHNPEDSAVIYHSLDELKEQWNRVQTDLQACEQELTQAIMKLTTFNAQLERVTTWLDDASFTTATTTSPEGQENHDELERIHHFKERLDGKYLDIVHLKQDYTAIEPSKQHTINATSSSPPGIVDKGKVVEDQLTDIDSKWSQLNGRIQEQ